MTRLASAPVARMIAVSLLAALAASAVGCMPPVPTSEKSRQTAEGTPCQTPDAVISDNDDNDNQVNVIGGRGGYWYTFIDEEGTSVWPTAGAHGGTFEMSPGGAESTPYAARYKGTVSATGSIVLAGMGMNFLDPKGGYDASKYKGFSFWAKKGPGSTGNVRLKVPDQYTDPDGGKCSECYNDNGINLTLTEEWQQFTIAFKHLKQLPGWGRPMRAKLDSSAVYGLQFQVNEPGATYDIWVDQIRFTGCGADGQ
jgi:endoglucanase